MAEIDRNQISVFEAAEGVAQVYYVFGSSYYHFEETQSLQNITLNLITVVKMNIDFW